MGGKEVGQGRRVKVDLLSVGSGEEWVCSCPMTQWDT